MMLGKSPIPKVDQLVIGKCAQGRFVAERRLEEHLTQDCSPQALVGRVWFTLNVILRPAK